MSFIKTTDLRRICAEYKWNQLFYLFCVFVLLYDFGYIFEITNHPIVSSKYPVTHNLQAIVLHITTSALILMPFFFTKQKKGFVVIIIAIINLYLMSIILYYRTYFTIMPLDSFFMINNLNGIGDNILKLFEKEDILLFIPLLSLIWFYFKVFRNRIIVETSKQCLINGLGVLLLSGIVIGGQLLTNRNDDNWCNLLSEKNVFNCDAMEGTSCYGFINCWGWQLRNILNQNKTLTSDEKSEVSTWIQQNTQGKEQYITSPFAKNQNVIIVIVESLESFPINKTVDGKEITPNLNKYIKGKKCLYIPHVLPQVKDGRSSDAQIMINAGVLPINSGATCFRYQKNTFNTLAKALHEKGFSTYTLLGGSGSFWNQGTLNIEMGYDKLFSIDEYKQNEVFNLGLTDSTFFSQSVDKLANIKSPFLAQLITLSSHAPFKLYNDRVYLKFQHDYPDELANYMNSIFYVDKCIGEFIGKLKTHKLFDNSTIIITGDHDAINKDNYKNLKSTSQLFADSKRFVPLIILNSPQKGIYNDVIGQIDIYPTLLDLLHISDYKWRGIGHSILGDSKPTFAISANNELVGSFMNSSSNKIEHLKQSWRISDLMITSNYFCSK